MWNYEKRLQYPVHIKTPNAKIAKIILTQYGGPYARNLERFFYLFKCERDLIKKMIQYFSPAGNRGVFFIEEKHPEGCFALPNILKATAMWLPYPTWFLEPYFLSSDICFYA